MLEVLCLNCLVSHLPCSGLSLVLLSVPQSFVLDYNTSLVLYVCLYVLAKEIQTFGQV